MVIRPDAWSICPNLLTYGYKYLARLDLKVEQRRIDYHCKIAALLAQDADLLVFEALNIKAMMARSLKSIAYFGDTIA